MKIGIDVQIADVSRAGIGQVTSELAKALQEIPKQEIIPLRPQSSTHDFSMPQRLWWDQFVLPRMAARQGVDVLLKTGFSTPWKSRVPTVQIVHDLAAKKFPEHLHRPSAWFYGTFVPLSFRWASKLVAISHSTASEIETLLHIDRSKIETMVLGADPLASPITKNDDELLGRFQLPPKFLLHIGTLEPRKNLAFLVRVWQKVFMQYPDIKLVLAGKDGWLSVDIRSTIRQLNAEKHVHILGAVSDDEKRALLRRASAFVFPSLYEGFGLPLVEAMKSGTPVIAARHSSIPEVVGDAGILIDGYDEVTWASHILDVLRVESIHRRLRESGLVQAEKFSWKVAAGQMIRVLTKVFHEASR